MLLSLRWNPEIVLGIFSCKLRHALFSRYFFVALFYLFFFVGGGTFLSMYFGRYISVGTLQGLNGKLIVRYL